MHAVADSTVACLAVVDPGGNLKYLCYPVVAQ